MSFFKTNEEKRIMQEMEREEQMQAFSENINLLKNMREEYALIAAEAKQNNDMQTYDTCVNNLISLNENISFLTQTKASFDIINVSNAIAYNMAMAVNALDNMANNKTKLPNLRKIQKVNVKVAKYMKQIKISNKTMANMMKTSSPANKQRSQKEIESVLPLIQNAENKLSGNKKINTEIPSFDISKEIELEESK